LRYLGYEVQNTLRYLGYEVHRIESYSPKHLQNREQALITEPPQIDPIWPLPRHSDGFSDEEIRKEFARYDLWHYAYKFDGGLSFSARHNNPGLLADAPNRPCSALDILCHTYLTLKVAPFRGNEYSILPAILAFGQYSVHF
jgi:hypothetical protein